MKGPGEFNPVLRREVRARWRTNKAFFVVFGYAIVLALLARFNYAALLADRVMLDVNAGPTSLSGRELFILFSQWQLAGWLMMAPLLTAGAIAGEREGGLLESLLLSHLRPEQITWGKWWSAMAFAFLLQLVPLPITAICFQLGGLAHHEFVLAALLQLSTAALGAAVGLYQSSKARRLDEAIGAALGNVLPWGWMVWFIALPLIFDSGPQSTRNQTIVLFAVAVQFAAAHSLIYSAALRIVRPLEDSTPRPVRSWFDEPEPARSSGSSRSSRASAPRAHHGPIIVRIGEHPPEEHGPAPSQLDDPARYKRWDMPGAERLRFENPVLQREVRTHLRLRAGQSGAEPGSRAGCAMSIIVFNFVLYNIKVLSDPDGRAYFWGLFATLWMFGATLAAAAMGAGAFTRERAARMLDFLWLTSLTPRQILWGKAAGAMVVVAYYSLAMAPALLPCLVPRFDGRAGLEAGHILGTLFLMTSATWASAAWGALVSWLCRQTFVATSVALLGLLLFPHLPLLSVVDPMAAIGRLRPFTDKLGNYREVPPWTPRDVLGVPLGLMALGAACALATLWLMRHGPRAKN